MFTYVPQKKGKTDRKIEVTLKGESPEREGLRLLYGRRIELEKTPAVRIDDIGQRSDGLLLIFSNYHPVYTSRGPLGHLHLTVTGKGKNQERSVLFDQDVETADHLDIPLTFSREGIWELNVKVTDLMTGLSAEKAYNYNHIAASPPRFEAASGKTSPELGALLKKSAAYCERLKKAALKFFCKEIVLERYSMATSIGRSKKWEYDYQIILQNGKLEEMRKNIKIKRVKGKSMEKAELETLYKSYYSFYLPATFLSKERQVDYRYELIDKSTLKKIPVLTAVQNKPVFKSRSI